MSGPRGYDSYRGRTPKGKVLLAVLLCIVIVAAILVLALQRFIVYDGEGRMHLSFLETRHSAAGPEVLDDELEIITPPLPEETPEVEPQPLPESGNAIVLPAAPLSMEGWSEFLSRSVDCSAAVIPLKAGSRIYYESTEAVPGAVETETDTADALAAATAGSRMCAARIGCFHDSAAANSDVEALGLKNTGHYIFYDGKNTQWLDPGKPAARAYLCAVAKEAASLGFGEIVLTELSYPTVGKLNKIAYGDTPIAENIERFLVEMRAALDAYDVLLAVELDPAVLRTGADETAGIELARVLPHVDRIYAAGTEEERGELSALLNGTPLMLETPFENAQ